MRVGHYRVIFKLEKKNILILGLGHRKDVYDKLPAMIKRLAKRSQPAIINWPVIKR